MITSGLRESASSNCWSCRGTFDGSSGANSPTIRTPSAFRLLRMDSDMEAMKGLAGGMPTIAAVNPSVFLDLKSLHADLRIS